MIRKLSLTMTPQSTKDSPATIAAIVSTLRAKPQTVFSLAHRSYLRFCWIELSIYRGLRLSFAEFEENISSAMTKLSAALLYSNRCETARGALTQFVAFITNAEVRIVSYLIN